MEHISTLPTKLFVKEFNNKNLVLHSIISILILNILYLDIMRDKSISQNHLWLQLTVLYLCSGR